MFSIRGIAKQYLGNMEDARTDLETALALAHEQDDGRAAAVVADALGKAGRGALTAPHPPPETSSSVKRRSCGRVTRGGRHPPRPIRTHGK